MFKYDNFETSIIDYRPTFDTNELGELVVSQCSGSTEYLANNEKTSSKIHRQEYYFYTYTIIF